MLWASPFKHFSEAARIRSIAVTFMMSVILLLVMHTLDGPLKSQFAPRGIVSFELAGNYEVSRQILNSWNAEARIYAALSLGLDYLFLIVYALFISLSCMQVGKALGANHSFLPGIALFLAGAQFFAAALDAIENWALIHLLLNTSRRWLPGLARWCAMLKFSIVTAGLIFIFGGLIAVGIKKSLKRPA